MERFVIYTRVSTKSQGKSGLGLEAQCRDIQLYLSNYAPAHEIIGDYQEVVTGAKSNRVELNKAIELARSENATLLVSKLDRLSRDVEFIAGLIKRVKLRVAAMPSADNFQYIFMLRWLNKSELSSPSVPNRPFRLLKHGALS